ncbi:MAG: MAPEG family protein [Bdellovibrionales bacterium]|nr:MAPEG family protein [Bdellovibrionales bacterium]
MNTFAILLPLFLNLIYTFAIVLIGFRIKSISVQKGETDGRYFKAYHSQYKVSEKVRLIERHYDNQFQLPLIYYATVGILIALNLVNGVSISLVWAFFISRMMHAYFHLSNKNVYRRATAYAVNWSLLLGIWIYILATQWGISA